MKTNSEVFEVIHEELSFVLGFCIIIGPILHIYYF